MWKCLGIVCMLGGMAGLLYNWGLKQREQQLWIESFVLFLKKTSYMMRTEKVKIVDYFLRYTSQEPSNWEQGFPLLAGLLGKVTKRLSCNSYPNGQMVWEEVCKEEEQNLHLDAEAFRIVVQAGRGFFGRSREENISFLEKSIEELEQQQTRIKEQNKQERKVWIPVGMLGTLMLIIIFI